MGASKVKEKLESVFPSVFTWATNPKESSVTLIKKYIGRIWMWKEMHSGEP